MWESRSASLLYAYSSNCEKMERANAVAEGVNVEPEKKKELDIKVGYYIYVIPCK